MFVEQKATNQSISMRKLIYGVGFNDADYITTSKINGKIHRCPFYVKWIHMLERCYSEKFHVTNPSYKECSVCEEWLTFSNFKKWMKTQKWDGMCLDKDLVEKGNKTYAPDKCIFVTSDVNSIVSKFGGDSKPSGVRFSYGKWEVLCSSSGKQQTHGRYKTKSEAENRYSEVKSEMVKEIALDQDDDVSDLLLSYFGID